MEEAFELPVEFNGEEILLPAKLMQFGYSYKIEMEVNGTIVSFERDDEGKWRALMITDESQKHTPPDQKLMAAIVESLHLYF